MTKYCKNCGRQLEDQDRFCDVCGKPSPSAYKAETTAMKEQEAALTSQGKRVLAFTAILVIILAALFIVPQFLYESSHRVPVENGVVQCVLGPTTPTFDPTSGKVLPPCPPPFNWNTFMLRNQWILALVIFVVAIAAVAIFIPGGHSGETIRASIICEYCGGNISPQSSFCPHCQRAQV